MQKLHEYPVTCHWTGSRDGRGDVTPDRSGIAMPLEVPPEFGGEGKGTNPEELLTSAVASCYSITFGLITENKKLPVKSYTAKVTGVVSESGPNFRFEKIVINPRIVLEKEASYEQLKLVEELAHKADAYCIVTNAVRKSVEVVVEPEIIREG